MKSPDPRCPVCQKLIASGTPVIFEHGELRHMHCYALAEGVVGLVGNFLKGNPDMRYCHTCLARYLLRERDEVEKAVTVLRLSTEFIVRPANCSPCSLARVTIQARLRT